MNTKTLTIEKIDEAGKGVARIALLSAVDSDGDTYAKGAFGWKEGGGQWVQMIPAHNKQAMPFGKAWLREDGDQALAEFTLNLDTQAGKEWHAALKFDLETGSPVQEWSYGYRVLDAAKERRDGKMVRLIKQLDVFEISPVLRGAGVGTGTISLKEFGSIKSAELKDEAFAPLIAGLGELADVLQTGTAALSATGLKQLGDIHAALGAALAVPALRQAEDERDQALTSAALGGYLASLSRRHLPG